MPQIQRWYKGFSYTGDPRLLVEQISKQVQQHNLSQFVPLLRLQKGVKRRGQFYFFLAIESSQIGDIPTEVSTKLLQLSFFKYSISGSPSFTYDQIKSMVGDAHDVYDYINQIPYQPLQEFTYENPFNLRASPLINNSSYDIDATSHRYEQLLYWLSALGCGTWESFKNACNILNIEEPKRILRRLRLLGHIESSLDGLRWSIAPLALVKVGSKSDFQEFILCGQMSVNLLRELEGYVKLKLINQLRADAPPCVRIQVDGSNILSYLIEQVSSKFSMNNAGEVSKQLTNILPELATWKQNLRHLQGIVLSLYEWERFDGNDFVICGLPTETGMYRMYNKQISEHPLYSLFYDQERDLWLQGDWYGLRFLALQHIGHQCIACYEFETKRLAIPLSQRLPGIYERALVLASGILPIFQYPWLLYENVEHEVVHLLSAKLNIKCNWESTYA